MKCSSHLSDKALKISQIVRLMRIQMSHRGRHECMVSIVVGYKWIRHDYDLFKLTEHNAFQYLFFLCYQSDNGIPCIFLYHLNQVRYQSWCMACDITVFTQVFGHITYLSHMSWSKSILSACITKTRLFKYTENFTTRKWKFSDEKFWYFSYFCIYVLSRNKKNNVYPCKPQFYYIKVGIQGVKII